MAKPWRGALPPDFQFAFEPSLFNLPLHRQLQSATGWESFYLVDDVKKAVLAAIHFYVQQSSAMSPCRATFGGLEGVDSLSEEEKTQLLTFSSNELAKSGIQTLAVKQAPEFGRMQNQEDFFLKAGFQIKLSEVDAFIEVDGEYETKIQPRKAKKLRSLRKKDYQAEQLSLHHLTDVYSFILKAREQKGYTLSMSLEQIQELANQFPDRVLLFGVRRKEEMIAAAICLKVKTNWLYDFYHDHDAAHGAESPVVLLMELIYQYCFDNSIKWLQLGTSMTGDQVNEGLILFKERLGAKRVMKNTYQKIIGS
jgi:predicted N-acyltransferase